MSKHTPGPWKAKKWVGTDPYDDPDRPFVEVGNVHWSPKNWKPAAAIEQTANAYLIAAAPELLTGLEDAVLFLLGVGVSVESPIMERLALVIRKAKGLEQ
jgi:hypothetical protein